MKTNWDLSHLYKTTDDWNNDFCILKEKMNLLNDKTQKLSISNVKEYLKLMFEIDVLIEKLYCFAKRHLDLDSTLTFYEDMLNSALDIYNESQILHNKFENFIINNAESFSDFGEYQRYIELIIRRKKHIMNAKNDEYSNYMNVKSRVKLDYQSLLNKNLKFESIEINGKKIDINRNNYNSLITNKNQEVRKEIFTKYTEGYKNIIEDISKLYIDKLTNDILISNFEKYDNLLQKKLYELELSNEILYNLIKSVNENLYVMYDYIEFKKKASSLDKYYVYDTSISLCGMPTIEYSFEEAIEIVKNSLKILGDDYIEIIDKALIDGWIDVYPNDYKRKMSFTSISYIGVPYILLNYDKSINSVRTIAHEIGHSINVYYSKNRNNYEYFEFNDFLTEIASKVNEFLFNEYLLDKSENEEIKKYLLNNIIGSIGNSLFGQVLLTEFEHSIINKLEVGEKVDLDVLNDEYMRLSKKYNGDSFEYIDDMKYGWSKIPHFIMQDTYSLYQYSIGTAIATDIAYRILEHEDGFVQKYKNFLSLGNSVTIEEALNSIGIDLVNGNYVENAVNVLNKKLSLIKKMY